MISKFAKNSLGFLAGVAVMCVPLIALAVAPVPIGGGLNSLGEAVPKLLNIFMQIIIAVSVGFIIYGSVEIMINGSDDQARKAGRAKLLWGLATVLIMLSVLGLIAVVRNTISINRSTTGLINPSNFLNGIK